MSAKPGDEAREIARGLRDDGELQGRGFLLELADRLEAYAASVDETFAVLTDPDAMAAIEEHDLTKDDDGSAAWPPSVWPPYEAGTR